MGTPSADNATAAIRVVPDVHVRLHELKERLGLANVSEAIAHLLDQDIVRIPMMPKQRERWTEAADQVGMPLPVWVVARVEGALLYGADRGSIELIYRHVREIRSALQHTPAPAEDEIRRGVENL